MINTDTMKQVYLLAQEHCGLKVGDWVKILRKAECNEAGWNTIWTQWMTKNIGKIGKIDRIDISGVEVLVGNGENVLENSGYSYPYFVLEKVEKPKHEFKPFDKVMVRNHKNQRWECNLFNSIHDKSFKCVCGWWNYCISHEGNEHLVGTTDEPEE